MKWYMKPAFGLLSPSVVSLTSTSTILVQLIKGAALPVRLNVLRDKAEKRWKK